MLFRTATLLMLIVLVGRAQTPLQQAYDALKLKNYDQAIAAFQQAIALSPARADIQTDLAYTLLKVGENEAARDQFAAAMLIDPADAHVALEYAFLCYETKQQAVARRIFDRLRKTGNATAEQAFQNIDRPLAEGIARWSKALEMSPYNFSAHQELATLAEQRDELPLAAEQYEKAWRLRPDERSLLLDLGRVWKELGRSEDAMSALLAASRGAQPRVAQKARDLLPKRYPYVYEFELALKLDPKNIQLRRELAYLLLEMGNKAEAEQQFLIVSKADPDDLVTAAQLGFLRLNRHDVAGAKPLLEQVLKGDDEELADRARSALLMPQVLRRRGDNAQANAASQAKDMAEKSWKAGYMKDALKYLTVAHEEDPVDFATILKLGWAYNMLQDDSEAIRWFSLARKSPDLAISSEATRAYNNLRPDFARVRTTVWVFPFFSTRWHDAFGYGQVKAEIRIGNLPFRPYLSVRFIGDVRGSEGSTQGALPPQYLSETSVIFGAGILTKTWRGLTGWFEAGEAVKYLPNRTDVGGAIPDFRGGLSYAKGFGHLLNGGHGLFFETNDDGIFVSRFANDVLLSSQNRAGYTFAPMESFDGFQAQFYWSGNMSADRLGQYWANFVESGPGLRFRSQSLPKSMFFTVNFVRGVYTVNEGNSGRPNFYDLRIGLWYALTH